MYQTLLSAMLLGLTPVPSPAQPQVPASIASIPIAPPADSLAVDDSLSASGVLVIDVQSGQTLFEKASGYERPMASLTKLMTALLIVENHDLDEWVTIPREATEVEGNKAYLPKCERFTVEDMLSALLIPSANDAAVALALFHSDSVTDFVNAMNDRADALGLTGTEFANPSGLDSSVHWSTPRDIAWLTMFALRQPDIRSRMGRRGERIASSYGTSIDLFHTHALLHANRAVEAGKTGTTPGAKECLVSLVSQEEQEYLIVIMHSSERYKDMAVLLDSIETAEVAKRDGPRQIADH